MAAKFPVCDLKPKQLSGSDGYGLCLKAQQQQQQLGRVGSRLPSHLDDVMVGLKLATWPTDVELVVVLNAVCAHARLQSR